MPLLFWALCHNCYILFITLSVYNYQQVYCLIEKAIIIIIIIMLRIKVLVIIEVLNQCNTMHYALCI